jgi:hypothetical protein
MKRKLPPSRRPERQPDPIVPDVVLSRLSLQFSNEQLIDLMHQYRDVRERDEKRGKETIIGIQVDGYNDDPRELGEIPEVQDFCERLVDLGFIADLTPSLMLFPQDNLPIPRGSAFGSLEVWCTGQGMLGPAGRVDLETDRLMSFVDTMLSQANQRADTVLGRPWHGRNAADN